MSAIESAGSFTMPPLTGSLDGLWEVILDLSDNLPPESWALVGGQMVMAHGLTAGRTATRASQDIDVLGNLLTSSTALRTAVAAVRELGFKPQPSMDGKHLHRFVRTKDNQAIDILAPDHSPPHWKPTTVPPLQTIQISGGNQALQRLQVITVTKGGHQRRARAQRPGIPHPQGGRLPGRQPGTGTPRRRCSVPRLTHHGPPQPRGPTQRQRPEAAARTQHVNWVAVASCLGKPRR
jgi:hypothetical protein